MCLRWSLQFQAAKLSDNERGTRKGAGRRWLCLPTWRPCLAVGCCRSRSARVTNFAGEVVDGTGKGSVGRAAEMMSTAHTPAVAVGSPRGLAREKGLECGGLVEAPIGRTPLPRDGRGRECGGALDLTHITLILTVAVSSHSSFGLSHYTHNVRILPTPTPMTGPLALGGLAIAKSQPPELGLEGGCDGCSGGLCPRGNREWSMAAASQQRSCRRLSCSGN